MSRRRARRSTKKRQQTIDLQSVRGDDEDDPDFWPAGDARASTDALVNGGVFAFLLHGPFANEERPNRWMSVSPKNAPNSDSRRQTSPTIDSINLSTKIRFLRLTRMGS
jgi:hypothetical protein